MNMKHYYSLAGRDYNGELNATEKKELTYMTSILRLENPTTIGGFMVKTFQSCDSCDFNENFQLCKTREEAEAMVEKWKAAGPEYLRMTFSHDVELVMPYGYLMPVTTSAMKAAGGVDIFSMPYSCEINGEEAACMPWEDGLKITFGLPRNKRASRPQPQSFKPM